MHLDWLIRVGSDRFVPVDRHLRIRTRCFSSAGFGSKAIPNSDWA
jgi:hypothetical protein